MAAESMGLAPFGLADLVTELSWPHGTDVGLIEQAGGVGAPQAPDGDGMDSVCLIGPDRVVLAAAAGRGALSPVCLASRALPRGPARRLPEPL